LLDDKKLINKLEDIELEFDNMKKDKKVKKNTHIRNHSADSLMKYAPETVSKIVNSPTTNKSSRSTKKEEKER
jgi:hypothetical protein